MYVLVDDKNEPLRGPFNSITVFDDFVAAEMYHDYKMKIGENYKIITLEELNAASERRTC